MKRDKGNEPYTRQSKEYKLKDEGSIFFLNAFPSSSESPHYLSLVGVAFESFPPAFPFKTKSSAFTYQSTSAPRNVAFATVSVTGLISSTSALYSNSFKGMEAGILTCIMRPCSRDFKSYVRSLTSDDRVPSSF